MAATTFFKFGIKMDRKCSKEVYNVRYFKKIKPLAQLNLWSISNEYFIYKPMEGDDDADCFHITNLKKENSTLLVPDTILDPSCKHFLEINNV